MSDDNKTLEATPTKIEQVEPIVEDTVQKVVPLTITDTTKTSTKKPLAAMLLEQSRNDPNITVETKALPPTWKPLQVKKSTLGDGLRQAWESRFVCLVLTMVVLLLIGGVSFAQVLAHLSIHGLVVSLLSFVGTLFTVRALYLCRETSLRSIG